MLGKKKKIKQKAAALNGRLLDICDRHCLCCCSRSDLNFLAVFFNGPF